MHLFKIIFKKSDKKIKMTHLRFKKIRNKKTRIKESK